MAIKLIQNGKIVKTISTKSADGAEMMEQTTESIPVVGQACMVQLSAGQTVNLGNYNSARFGVSISMPCGTSEVDATYELAKDWVDGKMLEMQQELEGQKLPASQEASTEF